MKNKRKLNQVTKSCVFASSLLLVVSSGSSFANSALKDEMGSMFNSMTNVTQPGVFETARRGVISGGSINVRNRIMNTNIVSMASPSISGGCGGLDFFGGSFSFINADQFVQLVRNIASNAVSYAFYLALDSMSAPIRNIMANLQERMQQLNEHMGNSCQLAQGIVTNGKAAIKGEFDVEANIASTANSVGDWFQSFSNITGRETVTEDLPAAEVERITGNIMWKALKSQNVGNWFFYGGDVLNQAVMSVSGTTIVTKPEDGSDEGEKTTHLEGNQISLTNLIRGGNVQMYVCDETDKCLSPSLQEVEIKGFSEMISGILLGDDSNVGITTKFRNGQTLTTSERNLLSNMPASAGAMITRLSRINESFPDSFVRDVSDTIALEMANIMIRDFYRAAKVSLDASAEPNANDLRTRVQISERAYMDEHQIFANTITPLSDVVAKYNQYLAAAGGSGLSSSDSTTGIK